MAIFDKRSMIERVFGNWRTSAGGVALILGGIADLLGLVSGSGESASPAIAWGAILAGWAQLFGADA